MIRKVISAILFAFCAVGVSAQMQTTRTITGMVVDKNGNPLVGAEVRATGGAETAFTDADGSFTMEVPVTLKSLTASYAGLAESRMKLGASDNLLFTLVKNRTRIFADFVAGGSSVIGGEIRPSGMIPQIGVMAGAYKKCGGYAKIMMGVGGPAFDEGKRFGQMPVITAGMIKRLSNTCNLFWGLGAGANYNLYSVKEYGSYFENLSEYSVPECDWAMALELGFMYRIKMINIVAGITYVTPTFDEGVDASGLGGYVIDNDNDGNFNFFVGVGITF